MSSRDIYDQDFDEECGKAISADTCPECTGTLVTEGGEISCIECGLVIDERRFDHGPEWTSFAGDETNSERVGAPLTPARHDRGLSTEIGYGIDARGDSLPSKKRRQLARLRREHTRARWRSTSERNLAHAFGEITRMTSALNLPKGVREEASSIHRAAQAADLIRGRSVETMASGSVYAACRCRGYPRSFEETAEVARCDRHGVELGYRVLNASLGLDAQVVRVTGRIPRLAAACEASDRVQHRALELAELAEETGLANGRNPAGVAAACLYLAGREFGVDYTQAELGQLAKVTPMTLRKRYHELQERVR